ncbi:cell division protein SepF [Actinomarinicola tropica]|uniref:Cell division protein SepF n=1 Tax=Actinomarinicola tropica TaxID=2789776 RepID=A0A5Q2RLU1_9ACTN|nr:cell division protein SepF [Actinomarinicola tropica]QGG95541.1 DUF552 domain-containing protein [Actinomarinicola tropica]
MSSMWRKAMVQLGLGDDDEYDDYDDQPVRRAPAPPPAEEPRAVQPRPASRAVQPRSVQPVPDRAASVSPLTRPEREAGGSMRFPTHGGPPEQPTVQPVPSARDERVRVTPAASTAVASGVRTIPRPNAKPHVVAPRSFSDAQEVGDTFKSKQPVIINLQGVDRDLSRRLVDFTSGLCYGIGGQMEKVATDVFLLTPVDVEVSAEERQRLQERGLYDS